MSQKLTYFYLLFGTLALGQAVVQVPGSAQIFLAGIDNGGFIRTSIGTDTAPQNSPAFVDFPLRPGQAVQIIASGAVRLFGGAAQSGSVGPNGSDTELWNGSQSPVCFTGTCIGMIWAPRGALVGIFLGEPNTGGKTFANFLSAAADVPVQQPLPWQPFLVGDGRTPEGLTRSYIVPRGATKLYLGILGEPVSGNTGSLTATVTQGAPVPIAGSVNPVKVRGNMTVLLAGMSDGAFLTTSSFSNLNSPDFAPVNSPVMIDLRRLGGHVLQIGAVGRVSCQKGAENIGPDGLIGTNVDSFTGFSPPTGFSEIHAPLGSLVGVFTGDQVNPQLSEFSTDYTTETQREVLQRVPGLQEYFYIGTGRTRLGKFKSFAIPQGATRLYLGVMDQSYRGGGAYDNTGWFFVSVTPDTGQEPAIGTSAVVNGASYAAPPLAAGSFASIFGERLGVYSEAAAVIPLPTMLANSSVWINGIPAPLYSVGPRQVNLQLPASLEGETEAQVVVSNGITPGLPAIIPLARVAPGIFVYGENKPVIVNAANGGLVSEDNSIKPGDTLIIYATGLGPVTPPAITGEPASLVVLFRASNPISVLVGSVPHDPAFAGLAPGLVGVYQVNLRVLPSVATGRQKLQLVSGRTSSNVVEVMVSH
ncbi:MAG: hypothetical protein M3Z36_01745 [Acidobacteriota bacterium]|nr:hypothetical protein [Acidobacteriota bacterium]